VAKFKNVSGEDLNVGPLNGRLILADQVFEVDDKVADAYAWGPPFYKAVTDKPDKPGKTRSPSDTDTTPED
jgi:hypothetical protein